MTWNSHFSSKWCFINKIKIRLLFTLGSVYSRSASRANENVLLFFRKQPRYLLWKLTTATIFLTRFVFLNCLRNNCFFYHLHAEAFCFLKLQDIFQQITVLTPTLFISLVFYKKVKLWQLNDYFTGKLFKVLDSNIIIQKQELLHYTAK